MNQTNSNLTEVQYSVGGRVYKLQTTLDNAKTIGSYLNQVQSNKDINCESIVRGKKLFFSLFNHHSIWTAFFLEQIEPDLLDWIDKIPQGGGMYDCGASTGPFSLYAAVSGAEVVAFEPDAQNFSMLEENNFLNKDNFSNSIKTFNIALSNEYGLGEMSVEEYGKGSHTKILDVNTIDRNVKGHKLAYRQAIIKFPLDKVIEDLKLPEPEYIKIDVDGSEERLIDGASKTLGFKKLKSIFIELEKSEMADRVVKKIEDHGFVVESKLQVEEYKDLHNYVFIRGD